MSDWLMKCNYCQTSSPELRRCTKCFIVYYCTKGCQRLDWPAHKRTCSTSTMRKPDTEITQGKHNNIADLSRDITAMKTETSQSKSKSISGLYDTCTSDTTNTTDEPRTGIVNVIEDITSNTVSCTESTRDDTKSTNTDKADNRTRYIPGQCRICKILSCTLTCAKCKTAFYCSKRCQKTDWPSHKLICKKVKENDMHKKESELTENEKRVNSEIKTRVERFRSNKEDIENNTKMSTWFNLNGQLHTSDLNVTTEFMRVYKRPDGSLQRALHFARVNFPGWTIIHAFDEIPSETFLQVVVGQRKVHRANILVAFMFMRHEHVIRHGVYLKDSNDEITCVQFYLHMDNPCPYFSYDQVRPGHYILIKNPVMHLYLDGQVGLKVEDPAEIKICEMNNLQ